jgi:hypothetical protein
VCVFEFRRREMIGWGVVGNETVLSRLLYLGSALDRRDIPVLVVRVCVLEAKDDMLA